MRISTCCAGRKLLSAALAFLLGFSTLVSCVPAQAAADTEPTTVRVGWYESEFNHMDQNGWRSGYAYDYQQEIAAHTGWRYEYVEGDWYDLLEMLQNGQIDLLSDVSHSPERDGSMLYSSQPMGEERYVLLVSADNKEISAGDVSSLNGKRVGVAEGNLVKDLYNNWASMNGVQSEVIELTQTQEEQAKLLQDGVVDAIVDYSGFEAYLEGSVPVFSVGTSDFYFAVNKDKPELKAQIDTAMNLIFTQDSNYNQELDKKYISGNAATKYFNDTEAAWLRLHGPIRIGYQDDYFPYSGTEDGVVSGLLKDIMDKASTAMKNADVSFEAVPYPSAEAAIEAARKGEVDLAFPVMYGDYAAEMNHLLLTNKVADSKTDVVVRKHEAQEFRADSAVRTAIVKGDTSHESIIRSNFPQWELVEYNTVYDCMKAVSDENADCYVVCDYRIGLLDQYMSKFGLVSAGISAPTDVTFAANEGSLTAVSVMNKLVGTFDSVNVTSALAHYSNRNRSVGFAEFVRDNIAFVVLMLLVLAVAATAVIAFVVHVNRRLRRQNVQIDLQNEELKKYQEHLEGNLEQEKRAGARDELTGLLNRRAYVRKLREIKAGDRSALCIVNMDVNGLKTVNDTLGHSVGDALIVGAADAIKCAFADIGTCYRIGGDEFVAIIQNCTCSADELRKVLKKSAAEWEGVDGTELSISVGVAYSTAESPKGVDELIEEADMEMYADKRLYYGRMGNDRRNRERSISKVELTSRISELRSIFDEVRIVDLSERRVVVYDLDGNEHFDEFHCFHIWDKDQRCENCVSAQAMDDHGRHSKIESKADGTRFFLTSQYINIDGSPALIEVLHKLDD